MLDLLEVEIGVTGGTGFVGRHLVDALVAKGCDVVRYSGQDLTTRLRADAFEESGVVFHLAAKCGGIGANMAAPAEFIADNLRMGLNVLDCCRTSDVKTVVMIGTLCAFPQNIPGPIEPEDLWKGYPEPTNAPYGIAKRTLVETGRAYHQQYGLNVVNVMPTNMYGPGDDFNPSTSHVIPALIRRFSEAKAAHLPEVVCWGTGKPTRDFLHVSDAVAGIIKAAEMIDDPDPVLLGSGVGVSMLELAGTIAELVGYCGRILWDASKPDGQPNRVVSTRSQEERLDFYPSNDLLTGLRETVEWWNSNGRNNDA